MDSQPRAAKKLVVAIHWQQISVWLPVFCTPVGCQQTALQHSWQDREPCKQERHAYEAGSHPVGGRLHRLALLVRP